MTAISTIEPIRHLWAKLAAGLAISAVLVLGTFVAPTSAAPHRGGYHRGYERHFDRRRGSWNGGYYRAPPAVYGAPYYYPPPPVVYAPGIGIALPGVSIGIR
jgi:hypothetical protein